MVIGLGIKPDRIDPFRPIPVSFYKTVVFIDNVYGCVDHQSTQQNQGGKSPCSEIDARKIESQESADKRDRDQRNNHEGLTQRLEQDRTGKKDNHHNKQNQPILSTPVLIPPEALIHRPETHWLADKAYLVEGIWGKASINKEPELKKYASRVRTALKADPTLRIQSENGGYVLMSVSVTPETTKAGRLPY